MLQRLRVGVLAGLHEIVQVEVARDERGGLAVRLVQGQRLVPLQVAHNLLEARARLKPWDRSVFISLWVTARQLRPLRVQRPYARRARSAAEVPE